MSEIKSSAPNGALPSFAKTVLQMLSSYGANVVDNIVIISLLHFYGTFTAKYLFILDDSDEGNTAIKSFANTGAASSIVGIGLGMFCSSLGAFKTVSLGMVTWAHWDKTSAENKSITVNKPRRGETSVRNESMILTKPRRGETSVKNESMFLTKPQRGETSVRNESMILTKPRRGETSVKNESIILIKPQRGKTSVKNESIFLTKSRRGENSVKPCNYG